MGKERFNEAPASIQILWYIRKKDGRVYREELELFLEDYLALGYTRLTSEESPSSVNMEEGSPVTVAVKQLIDNSWIEGDIDGEGVVSIPSKREEIKKELDKYENPDSMEINLRQPSIALVKVKNQKKGTLYSITQNNQKVGDCTFIRDEGAISVVLCKENERYIQSFCLNDICTELIRLNGLDSNTALPRLHFVHVEAKGVSFKGRTRLIIGCSLFPAAKPWFSGVFDFSGSTFEDDVVLQNIDYQAGVSLQSPDRHWETIKFRDCSFLKNLKIQDLRLTNTTGNGQFSLEDAKVGGNLMISMYA